MFDINWEKIPKKEDCRTFHEEKFNMDKLRTNSINICIFVVFYVAIVLKNIISQPTPFQRKICKTSSLSSKL